jgi:hypothetical protein
MMKAPLLAIVIVVLTVATAAQPRTPKTEVAPHPQANLPPLKMPTYDARLLPRPPEVIRATYKYAAEHPEVLSYMPCFCGCDRMGHHSNEDCFVKSREKNGDVTEFNEHGIACAMCLAVAERAKQMSEQGAALVDIRADIERRYAQFGESRTVTPLPPKK